MTAKISGIATAGFLQLLAMLLVLAGSASAQQVNIYSSRHYETDERLYAAFEAQTGIRINRLEGGGDALIARLQQEGRNSPADILLTVDAGRLWRAEQAELFAPVDSDVLNRRIPDHLRHPEGLWFGYSTRARLIFFNASLTEHAPPERYEDLTDPKWRGQICVRSSSNIYNLSLMASLIAHHGVAAAEDWARGVVANFARKPQGGDTDQLRAAAAGECAIAIANSYYFLRLVQSDDDSDTAVVNALTPVFPNQVVQDGQPGRGAHVNVSGAGVLQHAPNRAAAIRFLDYLAGDSAQRYFSAGNNEFPVVETVAETEALRELGDFRVDKLNVSALGRYQPEAQMAFDRAGWP